MMTKSKKHELEVVNIRLVKEPSIYSTDPVTTPEDVLKVIAKELSTYDREVFAVLNLKSNGQVINLNICSVGTLNSSMVSPREVFKSSILSNAAGFIAIHNHPSGIAEPSEEDIITTRRLAECGKMMNIKMLDHIIVAGESGDMMSFKTEGLMDEMSSRLQEWQR